MSDNEWEKSAVLFCVLYTSTSRANLSFHFTTGIKLFICNYYCDLSNRLCFFQYKTHLCGIKTAKSQLKKMKTLLIEFKIRWRNHYCAGKISLWSQRAEQEENTFAMTLQFFSNYEIECHISILVLTPSFFLMFLRNLF